MFEIHYKGIRNSSFLVLLLKDYLKWNSPKQTFALVMSQLICPDSICMQSHDGYRIPIFDPT